MLDPKILLAHSKETQGTSYATKNNETFDKASKVLRDKFIPKAITTKTVGEDMDHVMMKNTAKLHEQLIISQQISKGKKVR